jgi:hypothetical protein
LKNAASGFCFHAVYFPVFLWERQDYFWKKGVLWGIGNKVPAPWMAH